jgi:hypothetical protein
MFVETRLPSLRTAKNNAQQRGVDWQFKIENARA